SEPSAREVRAQMRLARGDLDGALEDRELALARAREIKDLQALLPALVVSATMFAALGRETEARTYAHEALEIVERNPTWAPALGGLNVLPERLGLRREIRKIMEEAAESPWREAAQAGAEGDLRRAASVFERMGLPTLAARAGLAAAEDLIQAGRRGEGGAELRKALEFYRSVGATFFIERGEALLAKTA
ncbi:MAG: hypothetical protein M3364_05875, partial [Actinomycetota bacterium]|nr:hypothetical protein [Actinomycetota bacterium]